MRYANWVRKEELERGGAMLFIREVLTLGYSKTHFYFI